MRHEHPDLHAGAAAAALGRNCRIRCVHASGACASALHLIAASTTASAAASLRLQPPTVVRQVLVLDEADRILDMGFDRELRSIVQSLPDTRQTLLFSATLTKSVRALAQLSLKSPEYVTSS